MKDPYAKRIFVTGGAGFIGSNYLNYVVPKYPDELFVNLDALTYAADLRNVLVDDQPNYVFEKVDINDAAALKRLFEKYEPTKIIHFAAESHVDQSITNPSVFAQTNVIGTNNLAYLARDAGVERFHFISTDEVYGDLQKDEPAFTETSPYRPSSPYSASKAAAELLVLSYMRTYDLPVVITRSANNYGPNQDRTKLMPKFIMNLLEDKKVPLYATGENIRTWLYVSDNVEATDLVFRKGRTGEVYDIAGPEELSNMQVTKTLLDLLGKDESSIEYVTDRLGHDFRYALTGDKLANEFGWRPKTTFAQGLAKTIAYYKKKAAI